MSTGEANEDNWDESEGDAEQEAYEAGIKHATDTIVAWLRTGANRGACRVLADAIQRGEHLENP